MIPHPYVYEKLVVSRHDQIQREMQQIRMLAYARQQKTLVRFIVGTLGRALIVLGSYMKRTGQQKGAPLHSS